ncbi:MAG TPA: phosphotransferase [Solirubrobacteraceae bacterium]|nr:phosphotransferase [Solirubrobacteraceae bacterium]
MDVDVEELRAHLAAQYGIRVEAMLTLDESVVLMRRTDGPNWVARVFPPSRPLSAVSADAEILAWLADQDYPAERCATDDPVSVMDGRAVLVTEAVRSVPLSERRAAIKDAGGLRRFGELLAILAKLPTPEGAPSRPGGAWHHMTDGAPAHELAAARTWLEEAEERAPARELGAYGSIYAELEALDDGTGLPQAFIHSDFVLANAVATPEHGIVLVDWAGSGRGPRVWALAFLLWAEASKDPRRAALAFAGYRSQLELEPEEVRRLGTIIRARPLIFDIWRLRNGSKSARDVAADILDTQALAAEIARRVAEQVRG